MSKIVERTLDLLELFAQEKRPLSLSDIARLLSIPISSCHDVLQAMLARGYLYELGPRAGYYPTLRLQRLGEEIGENDPVAARADPLLRPLRDALDESVLLSKVTGLQANYLLTFEPTHPLRFLVKVGDGKRSLHTTSGGKALLANLDPAALDAFLKSAALTPLTERSITAKTDLRKDLALGLQRGWFVNQGESLDGVTTLSATFRSYAALYIVTVAGPSSRMDDKLERAIGLVTNVCKLLEMRLDAAVPAATRVRAR